jgi:16S rRNA (cytosine967-C5)-methyltransferase
VLKDAWMLALEALSWIELQNLNEKLALNKTARQLRIQNPSALGLAYRLVYETVRRKDYLDTMINQVLVPHSINDFELGVRAFLRMYTYKTKIEHKGNILKEAIEIARIGRSILGWQTLQPVEKAFGTLLSLEPKKVYEYVSDEERVALRTYHPAWFVKYCFKLLGRDETIRFLESSQTPLPTYICINTLKADEGKTIKTLQGEGVSVEKVLGIDRVYKVTETEHSLTSTREFKEGFFSVQDKASCLAVEVAAPESDWTVLDVCAAPGSKTTHLAMLMQNKGAIYPLDYSRRRMKVWKHNTVHEGVENASPVIADAREPLPFSKDVDLVFLDPPCTNTGVFARIPSAKWRLIPYSIAKMAEVQWQMLRNCAEKVRENGWLIYSISSICVEENEMQVERFLRLYPEFKLVEAKPRIGLPGLRGLAKCQRLYPHIHDCDGVFIAKLHKET